MSIRLGIVGCGRVVQACHLPALRSVPEFTVTALCDHSDDAMRVADLEFGLGALHTRDLAALCARVDAALVAVSPRFHASVAAQLLQSGVHVLCEKPLSATVAEAESMVATANENRRLLAVCLPMRFHPNNEILRTVIADGMLGEIVGVIAEHGTVLNWPMTSDAYYRRATTTGGVFYDTGVHTIDRALWLFGPPRDISYQDDSYGGVESNAVLSGLLRVAANDVPIRMAFSWTHRLSNGIRVVGSDAIAEGMVAEPDAITVHKRLAADELTLLVRRSDRSRLPDPLRFFREQWRDFASAIRDDRPPFVAGDSAVAALRLIEQAYAARTPLPQPWVEPEAFSL